MKSWTRAAASLFFASIALGAAQAQEPFYKGKTLELIIGYPTGGSNDVYARLLSTHLGKHIPGNPTVVARNMPGAGSFLAANHMTAVAPRMAPPSPSARPPSRWTRSWAPPACASRPRR